MAKDSVQPDDPLFCARCAAVLHPGAGDFFQVTIEAVADPYPPVVEEPADEQQLRRAIEKTLAELSDLTAREALEQVYRKVIIHLCLACYPRWIENPAGT